MTTEAAVQAYAEIEIGLHRHDAESYRVEVRFSRPDSETDNREAGDELLLARFSQAALDAAAAADTASGGFAGYGQALSEMLFAAPAARGAFTNARAAAEGAGLPLRIRVYVGPSAPELHRLRWETLHDPERRTPLVTGATQPFSRYLSSTDWRPVRLRSKGELRALVVVANPSNMAEFGLAPVNIEGELQRAYAELGGIVRESLATRGAVTLEAIGERLRAGFDILYVICHGRFIAAEDQAEGGESYILLENRDGSVKWEPGQRLVEAIRELEERPRLIILASCESAGDSGTLGDGSPLNALGPSLAQSGVPAVLAMQGKVSMATVSEFMPAFFQALQEDGQVDRAVAVARRSVAARDDAWMPVLFTRLRNGRIWYNPGFSKGASFEGWDALVSNINAETCTPILGPLFNEAILGSPAEMANRWAQRYNFPMEAHQRDDLPQVAQFLTVKQDWALPRRMLAEHLREELLARYGPQLGPLVDEKPSLGKLFSAVGALLREGSEDDPYRVMAKLPFRVYITALTDNLLLEALKAEGKRPRFEICRWNKDLANTTKYPSPFDKDSKYTPTPEEPLVYYIFGVNAWEASLVLTEDDYFDFLIGATRNNELIPKVVREVIADSGLLFLGFRLEEWAFRVLFRILDSQEGRRRDRYTNIAGQITPEDGLFLEPERARLYLEKYFGNSRVNIFWGSVKDFAHELNENWKPDDAAAAASDPFG
jgi:hypothetical protein